jgi:hypothetical protein
MRDTGKKWQAQVLKLEDIPVTNTSGRGLAMVYDMVDSLVFQRQNNQNLIQLMKTLPPGEINGNLN